MKKQLKFYSLLLLLMATSCIQESEKKTIATDNVKKGDIVGTWSLTQESLEIIKSNDNRSKNRLISKFELRSDSSAIISFMNPTSKQEIKGTWSYKESNKFGDNNAGVEYTSDVLIRFMATTDTLNYAGLRVKDRNGRITLNGENDIAYEKL